MIELRKNSPALIYGDYKDLDPENTNVFAYTRTLGDEEYLVILNFSGEPTQYALPGGRKAFALAMTNLRSEEQNTSVVHLKPWEARVYRSQTVHLSHYQMLP